MLGACPAAGSELGLRNCLSGNVDDTEGGVVLQEFAFMRTYK
jgi:hypothetical protein